MSEYSDLCEANYQKWSNRQKAIEGTRRSMWELIHKLATQPYKSSHEQLKDAKRVGELAVIIENRIRINHQHCKQERLAEKVMSDKISNS